MSESSKDVVRELFAAWNARDIERAEACIGDGCNGGGREGFRKELTGFVAAFPDMTVTLEDMLSEGDKVATRVTIRGTHLGPLGSLPATGKAAIMKANHLFRVEGGHILQRHGQMDRLESMTQLGMKLTPQA